MFSGSLPQHSPELRRKASCGFFSVNPPKGTSLGKYLWLFVSFFKNVFGPPPFPAEFWTWVHDTLKPSPSSVHYLLTHFTWLWSVVNRTFLRSLLMRVVLTGEWAKGWAQVFGKAPWPVGLERLTRPRRLSQLPVLRLDSRGESPEGGTPAEKEGAAKGTRRTVPFLPPCPLPEIPSPFLPLALQPAPTSSPARPPSVATMDT